VVYARAYAYVQRVRSIPGVAAVNGEVWFGGTYEEEDVVTFPSFAIDPDTVAEVSARLRHRPVALEKFRSSATPRSSGARPCRSTTGGSASR
jgi:hypothetical protein